MAGAGCITPTVLEEKDADGFDGYIYSPAVLKLLHKLEDGFVDLIPLSLKKNKR